MDRRFVALGLVLLLGGCTPAIPAPSPTPSPAGPSPTPGVASPEPSPSPAPEALYLRAWMSQALPPEATFGWLPTLTISDGLAIDGNVAIPMIYPGPLTVLPNARGISEQGQSAIVGLARDLQLLDGRGDFSQGGLAPGAAVAHVLLVVDGVTHELSGDPHALSGDPHALGRCAPGDLRCVPEPGTAEAFALYWARLSYLDDWLGAELGPVDSYQPERLAVVTMPPQPMDMAPNFAEWPLEQLLAEFGHPWGPAGSRCAVVDGADLDSLLPAALAANQLTLFLDGENDQRALLARALVPGESSPCEALTV